jgi:hypothetical protein
VPARSYDDGIWPPPLYISAFLHDFFFFFLSYLSLLFLSLFICSPPSIVTGEKEMLQSLATSPIAAAVPCVFVYPAHKKMKQQNNNNKR